MSNNQPETVDESLQHKQQINVICDAFETRWRSGAEPDFAAFLEQMPANGRDDLLHELIQIDVYYRHNAGKPPSVEDYQRRFPELSVQWLQQVVAATNEDIPHKEAETAESSAESRYRIVKPHAKGGLGEVFVAKDTELNRDVALKQIRQEHAGHGESRGRFLLEAEICGGLEHPGIVPVYGCGQYADGRPFYAMRFIKGDNLKEAVERFHGQAQQREADDSSQNKVIPLVNNSGSDYTSLAFRQLLHRFVDVCNAMAYAHSRGILHRDLKPGNIMLGKYGETLVVDWGLAKPLASDEQELTSATSEEPPLQPTSSESSLAATQMGSALGTPAYMSPEQAAGRWDEVGPASDIYSLGATLYTVLTGRSPIDAKNKDELFDKVRRGDIVPPRQRKPGIPAALEAVCLKAMSLRPADRYGTCLT